MRIPFKTAITAALQGFYDFSYNLFAAGKRTLAVSFIHKRKSFFQSGLNVIFKTPFEFGEQLFAKHKVECVFLSTAARDKRRHDFFKLIKNTVTYGNIESIVNKPRNFVESGFILRVKSVCRIGFGSAKRKR